MERMREIERLNEGGNINWGSSMTSVKFIQGPGPIPGNPIP